MGGGGGDRDGRKKVGSAPVVSGGDASEFLELAEHLLNGASTSAEVWREAIFPVSCPPWRDVGDDPGSLHLPPDPIAVIALVSMWEAAGGDTQQQGFSGCRVAHATAGQMKGKRSTLLIA